MICWQVLICSSFLAPFIFIYFLLYPLEKHKTNFYQCVSHSCMVQTCFYRGVALGMERWEINILIHMCLHRKCSILWQWSRGCWHVNPIVSLVELDPCYYSSYLVFWVYLDFVLLLQPACFFYILLCFMNFKCMYVMVWNKMCSIQLLIYCCF